MSTRPRKRSATESPATCAVALATRRCWPRSPKSRAPRPPGGLESMATTMKTTRDVKGVGLSIPRPDGPEKVTGQVQYVADLKPRGLLHAKLLRSPHAHARIVSIDTSRARALPGVRAVITAADIPQQAKLGRGDVAKGFAESDVVIEKTYRIPMVHQGYLEPHAVLAQWDTNGQLTLWASTQGSFNTRSEVAEVLELPENTIKVIPMECGGGFGGKIRALCEPITAVLARVTGRPVRYVMTRREELEAGNPAPQVIIRLKSGVKRDGTLMALEAETVIESGAVSGTVLAVAAVFLGSLYRSPAFAITGSEALLH